MSFVIELSTTSSWNSERSRIKRKQKMTFYMPLLFGQEHMMNPKSGSSAKFVLFHSLGGLARVHCSIGLEKRAAGFPVLCAPVLP